MEGESLLPIFLGRAVQRKKPLFWEHEGNWAVRDGKWKLVCDCPEGPWELYDLERDRTELDNLAQKHPDKVMELAAQWHTWAQRVGVLPWPYKPQWGFPRKEDD